MIARWSAKQHIGSDVTKLNTMVNSFFEFGGDQLTKRYTNSADRQLNIDKIPQLTMGKWLPKYDPQSKTMINSCL